MVRSFLQHPYLYFSVLWLMGIVLRHELVSALQLNLLEQTRFDKEHENPSAVSKFKDVSDVPMILSTDAAGRKHRHTTKNLYQTKGKLALDTLVVYIMDYLSC